MTSCIRIDARKKVFFFPLGRLWNFRALLYSFFIREIKLRYKHTLLGYAWAVFQPYLLLAICASVLGKIVKPSSGDAPFAVVVLLGLLPWQLFSSSVNQCSRSLLLQQGLIKKVYFPRILIPLSLVLIAVFDCAAAFPLLLPVFIHYKVVLTSKIFYAPFFLFLAFLYALGAGIWLSALTVKLRDIHHTLPFFTQAYFLVTPIAYTSGLFSKELSRLMAFNPLTGIIDGLRWSVFPASTAPPPTLGIAVLLTGIVLVTGVLFFHWLEPSLDDLL